jgi:hypothetical protein
MCIFISAWSMVCLRQLLVTMTRRAAKGSKVKFQALAHLSADVIAQVQNEAKRRILLAFVKCLLLEFKNQPCQRAWNMRVGRAVFLLLFWLYAREHARMLASG